MGGSRLAAACGHPESAHAARLLPDFGSANLPWSLGDARRDRGDAGDQRSDKRDVRCSTAWIGLCRRAGVMCGDGNGMNGGGGAAMTLAL
jgi:hypothetical protein